MKNLQFERLRCLQLLHFVFATHSSQKNSSNSQMVRFEIQLTFFPPVLNSISKPQKEVSHKEAAVPGAENN